MSKLDKSVFNCGAFDIKGLLTENYVYPIQWKLAMVFMSFAFVIMTITVSLTLVTCCRQSIFGKSIHNIAGAAQIISGNCNWLVALTADRSNNFLYCRHINIVCALLPSNGLGRGSRSTIVWARCRSLLAGRLSIR